MVTNTPLKTFTIAHSPDPDDAYMFYGFACGTVTLPGYEVKHFLADIQTLNERARQGEFEVSAISAHAYPSVSDKYWILNAGASVGRGYGPLIIVRPEREAELKDRIASLKIAVPGPLTTATLLLNIRFPGAQKVMTPFDQIPEAVRSGKVDAGLVIHESQLTYEKQGFKKIFDFGLWWQEEYNLPLPLGLDVVRKDLGMEFARVVAKALEQSIRCAYANEKESIAYALQFGRGIDAEVGKKFVGMYVNDDTLDMGEEGRKALQLLYRLGHERGLIQTIPEIKTI